MPRKEMVMNGYISKTKDVILDYLTKAQHTQQKIEEGKRIYQPDSMEREEKRLRGELMKARKEAEAKIDSIYHEASEEAREWGTLDGKKITLDAEIIKYDGVTPSEFDVLVDRYQDNYTMLNILKKYGDAQNKKAAKEAREKGDLFVEPYNTRDIPGSDAKMKEWDDMRKRADYFLNVADGTGFSSDFEKGFAKSTADKAFEAWGEDPQPDQKMSSEEIEQTFRDAWGYMNG